jgi:predicted  nucleic acid-binding Zn-ribbon protein
MPHQCTDCGRRFEDGSKEMLSGCPDCGGNKFQFHPDGVDDDPPETEEPPEPPEPAVDNTVARTVGNAATAVRDLVGGGSDSNDPTSFGSEPQPRSSESSTGETPPKRRDQASDQTDPTRPAGADRAGSTRAKMADTEDDAQASARSEVVSPDDLPSSSEIQSTPPSTPVPEESTSDESADEQRDRPDLSELREELNQQFESIRVLKPGQYELNLMELYDREEYIVALQEDGKYTIQVPERWED